MKKLYLLLFWLLLITKVYSEEDWYLQNPHLAGSPCTMSAL